MKAIPQDRLTEILTPIAKLFQAETNTEGRCQVEHAVAQVAEGYDFRTISAFVDDLDAPKCCLILKTSRSWMSPANVCVVMVVWVNPAHRGPASGGMIADMFKTMDSFAGLNECVSIYGSSWVYLGCPDISAMWSQQGFDLQEKVFIKTL